MLLPPEAIEESRAHLEGPSHQSHCYLTLRGKQGRRSGQTVKKKGREKARAQFERGK